MKALVFTDAGVVQYLDRPEPIAEADETVVTVRASAICGSELHGFRSVGFRRPPLIMGHEFAGVTPDGRRVVINPLLSCGECDSCRRGAPQTCRVRALMGVNRDGGFAERVAVPDSALRELPDNVTWSAAALIEPLANAVHACTLVGGMADHIGVVGAGPIGLLCAIVASSRGAQVVIADVSAERRATAHRLGFTTVPALTDEVDAVIDAVGIPATRQDSVARIRPGGTAVWIGLAVDAVEIGGNSVIRDEKRILGSFAYTADEFDVAVKLAGRVDLSWVHEISLSESESTFYALAGGDTSIVKAVIVANEGVS